jgi:phytoene desaturase
MPTVKHSSDRSKAAVIGSGFGGLAIAIRLQAAGYQTTLFERHDKPGGRAYVYEDEGFTFDAGPTVITAPDCLTELFELAGKKMDDYIELMPVSPMYRLLWEDGEKFDYYSDEKNLLAEISRLSPGDIEGYHRFYKYASEVYDEGYTKLCHVPFQRVWDMVKVAPKLVKLGAHTSVYSKVSQFFRHEKLRQAFSFNSLLIGGNPFRASSIYTLIHPLERKFGVYFPRGGTHALVRALVRLFTDLGGTVRLNASVDRIDTVAGSISGVTLRSGEQCAFDLVVSNADVTTTYRKLLRDEPRAKSKARSLERKKYSMSLYVLYFGTDRAFPGIVHHNVMFGPRYKDLLTDIFDRGVVADDFSLYLHAPTLSDPSLAPEGCHSFYVLSPVPHLGHDKFDWDKNGTAYGDRILDYLETRYMPGLKESIKVRRHITPLDFETRLDAHLGAAFSLEPTLTQSAYFRVHNRDDKIQGLYFVGAGTHPGAGIPGVIGSAKATAGVILGEEEKATATFGARLAEVPT